ncbi:MAG: MBL fold metallo-hydrolase, partial [Candidatus Omnitrophica bacterium]|nr:MBL fold metallo-hydrolase [Candidatus Omnitrophota bacterium]
MLNIYFIDVGYGDSILIQTPQKKTILIDAGYEQHSKKVIEFLKNRHVDQIDAAIITHPHKDHFGGFSQIIRTIPINAFFTNGDHHIEEGYQKLLNKITKNKK